MDNPCTPFVILNPHVGDWLAEPLSFRLLRRRALRKYGYLLDAPREHGQRIPVLICGTLSGLVPSTLFSYLPAFVREKWLSLELKLWRKINDADHLDFYFAPEEKLLQKPLIIFSWKNCEGAAFDKRLAIIKKFSHVIGNLSHYFVNTAIKAHNLNRIPNLSLWSESDLQNNPYFQNFFGWYKKPVIVVPFCVAPRFSLPEKQKERDKKCVATGSFHFLPDEKPRCVYEDFMRFFGTTNYHFVRSDLYQRRAQPRIKENINVLSAPYREKKSSLSNWSQRILGAGQKNYFAIDIVDVYQTHLFAVVGEERSGNPGIGIFEAMACGAIPIIKTSCYEGLGLSVSKNCLSYEGDVDSLLASVQKDEANLLTLQKESSAYIKEHCRTEKTYNKFLTFVAPRESTNT
ncbi:MAG TPA: hypothetical protein DD400_02815 [Rhodospirillaceae bacterium]|nr:hypothetical protein [Rhodospirillaceae bacterium]